MPQKENRKPNIFARMLNKIKQYFKEVRAELKKVSWPDKKELKTSSLVVLATLVVSALFIWIADSIISYILHFLL
jgi:preprotein translocase subunit SecE